MTNTWTTEQQDMYFARQVIAEHGGEDTLLGIFEMEMDIEGHLKQVRLSPWVMILIKHFRKVYGEEQGDFVTKKVMSCCMVNGQTVH